MFYLFLTGSVAIDALTKWWAKQFLADREISVIGELFQLRMVTNDGIAFGVHVPGLIIATLVALALLFWIYYRFERQRKDRRIDMGFGLILGGALGNAWERIAYGQVTDFFSVQYFSIFNVADICLTAGVVWILWVYFVTKGDAKPRHHTS